VIFLPHSDPLLSAEALRAPEAREAVHGIRTALRALKGTAIPRHPEHIAWKGYEASLARYGLTLLIVHREAFSDAEMHRYRLAFIAALDDGHDPWWFGLDALHDAHKSALRARGYEFDVPEGLPIPWPTNTKTNLR
jgi:hypothetical protein